MKGRAQGGSPVAIPLHTPRTFCVQDGRAGFRQGQAQGMPQTWAPILGSLQPRVARPTDTSTPEQVLEEECLESGARNSPLGPEAPGKVPLSGSWKDDVALLGGKEETSAVPGSRSSLCKCSDQGEAGAQGSTGWAGSGMTSLERKTETFILGAMGSLSRLYREERQGQICYVEPALVSTL